MTVNSASPIASGTRKRFGGRRATRTTRKVQAREEARKIGLVREPEHLPIEQRDRPAASAAVSATSTTPKRSMGFRPASRTPVTAVTATAAMPTQ
jgi:hypothetical protein